MHFAIEGDAAGLRAGQFVTVLAATGEASARHRGAAQRLVRTANGQDIVFEHVSAERFERARRCGSSRSTASAC